jgi:hypothetical protein
MPGGFGDPLVTDGTVLHATSCLLFLLSVLADAVSPLRNSD